MYSESCKVVEIMEEVSHSSSCCSVPLASFGLNENFLEYLQLYSSETSAKERINSMCVEVSSNLWKGLSHVVACIFTGFDLMVQELSSRQIFLCFPQILRGIYDLKHCSEENGQYVEKPSSPDKLDTFFHQSCSDSSG